MKKFLILLQLFVLGAMLAKGQNVDANVVQARTNLVLPWEDTTFRTVKIGELRTRPQDSALYRYVGRGPGLKNWDKLSFASLSLGDVLLNGNTTPLGMSIGFLKIPALGQPSQTRLVTVAADGTFGSTSGGFVHGTMGYMLYYAPDGTAYTTALQNDTLNLQFVFGHVLLFPSGNVTLRNYDIASVVDNNKAIGYSWSGSTITEYNPVKASISATQILYNLLQNTARTGPDATHKNGAAGYIVESSHDSSDAFVGYHNVTAGNWRHSFVTGYTEQFGRNAEWSLAYQPSQSISTFYNSIQLMGWDSAGNWRAPHILRVNVDSTSWKPLVMDASGNIREMYGWAGGGGSGGGINLTNIFGDAPLVWNNSTGHMHADTTTALIGLATKGDLNSYVNKTSDTSQWHTSAYMYGVIAAFEPSITKNQIGFGSTAGALTSNSSFKLNTKQSVALGDWTVSPNVYSNAGGFDSLQSIVILGTQNSIANNFWNSATIIGWANTLAAVTNSSNRFNTIIGQSNTIGVISGTFASTGNSILGATNLIQSGIGNVALGSGNQIYNINAGSGPNGTVLAGLGLKFTGPNIAAFYTGQYNDYTYTTLRIAVGNGTSDGSRSNLWDIDGSGNMFLQPGNTAARPTGSIRAGTLRINIDSGYRTETYDGTAWHASGTGGSGGVVGPDTLNFKPRGPGIYNFYVAPTHDTAYYEGFTDVTNQSHWVKNPDSSMSLQILNQPHGTAGNVMYFGATGVAYTTNMVYDSTNTQFISPYKLILGQSVALNTPWVAERRINNTLATNNNVAYGGAEYSDGAAFVSGTSISASSRRYTVPTVNTATADYVYEYSTNNGSYTPAGKIHMGAITNGESIFGRGSYNLMSLGYTEVSSAANITSYWTNCTSGTFTVTLPNVTTDGNNDYSVVNSGSGVITVQTTSSQNITTGTSTTTFVTLAPGTANSFHNNGAKWYVTSTSAAGGIGGGGRNIYNSDSTLANNRTITSGGNSLTFTTGISDMSGLMGNPGHFISQLSTSGTGGGFTNTYLRTNVLVNNTGSDYGLVSDLKTNNPTGSSSHDASVFAAIQVLGAGTVGEATGIESFLNMATGTVTNYEAFHVYQAGITGGTITNFYGMKLDAPSVTGSAVVTHRYGVYQGDVLSTNVFNGPLLSGSITPVLGQTQLTGTTNMLFNGTNYTTFIPGSDGSLKITPTGGLINLNSFIVGQSNGAFQFGSVVSNPGTPQWLLGYITPGPSGGFNHGGLSFDTLGNTGLSGNATVNGNIIANSQVQEGVLTFTNSTLTLGSFSNYVFSGNTSTVTLPALSGTISYRYHLKNRGSGNMTINTAGSDNMYTSASTATYTLNPGSNVDLYNDGTYWLVENAASSGGSANWGSIGGTLSSQSDLTTALALAPTLLISATISPAATVPINLSSYYLNYKTFEIRLHNIIIATKGSFLQIRVSTDGTTYDASGYGYAFRYNYTDGTGGDAGIASTTGIAISPTSSGLDNTAPNGTDCTITLYNTADASRKFQLDFHTTFWNGATTPVFGSITGSGVRTTPQITKAIELLTSSGNITQGTYEVYGYN